MSARFRVGHRDFDAELRRVFDGWRIGDRRLALEIDGATVRVTEEDRIRPARAVRNGRTWWVWVDGVHFRVQRPAAEIADGSGPDRSRGRVQAPMTGKIVSVAVEPGATVSEGDELVRMEAMKMVYTLTAPVGGIVERIGCREGEVVEADRVLIEIEPAGGEGE